MWGADRLARRCQEPRSARRLVPEGHSGVWIVATWAFTEVYARFPLGILRVPFDPAQPPFDRKSQIIAIFRRFRVVRRSEVRYTKRNCRHDFGLPYCAT